MNRLLSYKYLMTIPFGDGEYKTVYELTLLKTTFFGLRKKTYTMTYDISMFGNIESYKKHWDSLIATGAKFK